MKMKLQNLTHDFILPLWQDKSLEVIDRFVAPDADIQTTFVKGTGPSAFKQHAQKIFNALFYFEFAINEIIQAENQIIYKWHGKPIYNKGILRLISIEKNIIFSGMIAGKIVDGSISHYCCFSDIPQTLALLGAGISRTRQFYSLSTSTDPVTHVNPVINEQILFIIRDTTGKNLTKREIECLSLWLKGFSIKESAKLLGGLSSRTIQTFRENIKRKLTVNNYQKLLTFSQEIGILPMILCG